MVSGVGAVGETKKGRCSGLASAVADGNEKVRYMAVGQQPLVVDGDGMGTYTSRQIARGAGEAV